MTKKKPAAPAVPDESVPAALSQSDPSAGASALGEPSQNGSPAPATLDDVIPLAPLDDASTPNVEAALGALDAPAIGPPGTSPPASGAIASPGTPAPGRWSQHKIKRSNRRELMARVRELQEAPPPAPIAGAPGEAPAPTSDEVTGLLRSVLPAVDACLTHFGGAELAISESQRELLAKVWAPPALPYYVALKARLPLLPALVATLGVYVPKAISQAKASAKLKSATAADVVTEPVAPLVPVPDELPPVPDAPPAIVAAPDVPGVTMPYGGPKE